jgi:DNA polymerase III epsilon subunit-like protein
MDWLGVSGYVICTLEESDDDSGKEYFRSTYKNVETILAEYFGIDLKKVEQEQRALLCAIRAQGSSSANKVP